jgi:hypothetical protein
MNSEAGRGNATAWRQRKLKSKRRAMELPKEASGFRIKVNVAIEGLSYIDGWNARIMMIDEAERL